MVGDNCSEPEGKTYPRCSREPKKKVRKEGKNSRKAKLLRKQEAEVGYRRTLKVSKRHKGEGNQGNRLQALKDGKARKGSAVSIG